MLRHALAFALALSVARLAPASPHHRPRAHTPRPPSTPRTPPTPAPAPIPAPARPPVGTPSPGCTAADAPPRGVHESSLAVGARTRTFLLSVPETYDAHAQPWPLVVALHGRTGTPRSLRGYLGVEQATDGHAIVVYPAGLRVTDRRGRSTTRWDTHGDGVDVAFFDALLAELGRRYCIDLGRVFVVGHSAGAVMANELTCHRGTSLRAAAIVAGSGPWSRACTAAPSVWITHGRRDADVAWSYGERTRDRWISLARCAPDAHDDGNGCTHWEGCADDARVTFCAHDGDHGPPDFTGPAVWRFFLSR